MGSTTSELGLDLKLPLAMKTINDFVREVSASGDDEETLFTKLEEYMRGLEEEKVKIEAFKRELPLCMLLLNDVIGGLKEELAQCQSGGNVNAFPVLERSIPIKGKFEEEREVKLEEDRRDKMNWMSSAQLCLWSDNYNTNNSNSNNNNSNSNNNSKKNAKERGEEPDRRPKNNNLSVEYKYRSGGGAFVPFKGLFSGFPSTSNKEEKEAVSLPDLSLVSPGMKNSCPVSSVPEEHRSDGLSSKSGGRALDTSSVNAQMNLQARQQHPRKARRCWSPVLHRRFVSALQQLGGSQATPKQIRELMKVDGLTNDEVKSHLQKYRIHSRRLPSSLTPANQSVVMLGDLWVPQDHYSTSKQSASQSGSPQGPLQLAGAARGISVTGGDSSEEEEDGKSGSYSWKGHLQRSGEEETD